MCHFKGNRGGQLTSSEALFLYVQKEMFTKNLLLAFLQPCFQLPDVELTLLQKVFSNDFGGNFLGFFFFVQMLFHIIKFTMAVNK